MSGLVDVEFAMLGFGDDDPDGYVAASATNRQLHLVRAARASVGVSSARPTRGHRLRVSGRLRRADWNAGVYTGYRARPVRLQFRARGDGWHDLRTVTSSRAGSLAATFVARRDGRYRWVFDGNPTSGPATSAPAAVDVR